MCYVQEQGTEQVDHYVWPEDDFTIKYLQNPLAVGSRCRDPQSGIRNTMISDSTNCLLYRVSGFSIPSWFTCWVRERPAVLSDTFQRAEDLEATGVLTSSLQDKCVWTVLSTNKLLVLVCEPWCSLITSYTSWGKPISSWGNLYLHGGNLYIW